MAMTKQELTQAQVLQGGTSMSQVSTLLFGRANQTGTMSNFVEIDITGLSIRQGLTKSGDQLRPGVQFMLNSEPLDLTGRIIRNGKVMK